VPLVVFTMQTETFLIALREQRFLFTVSLSRNIVTPLLLVATLPILGLWGAVATKLLVTISLVIAELNYLFAKHTHLRFTFTELMTWNQEDKKFFVGMWQHARKLLSVKLHSVLG
jgi:O-antigen/teichoic acid export membrane protein